MTEPKKRLKRTLPPPNDPQGTIPKGESRRIRQDDTLITVLPPEGFGDVWSGGTGEGEQLIE